MNLHELTDSVTALIWEQNIEPFIEHLNTGAEPSDHIMWKALSLEMIIKGEVLIPEGDETRSFTDMDDLLEYLVDDDETELIDSDEDMDEVEQFIETYGSPVT